MTQEIGERRDPHGRIGAALAEARRAAGLSAAQIGERTRISPEVLGHLERGEFADCGGDVYARGHIRSYARAVGLDPETLLADYGDVRLPPLTRRDLRRPRVVQAPQEAAGAPPHAAARAVTRRARSFLPTIIPGAVPSLVPMAGALPPPDVPALSHRRRADYTDADAGSAASLPAAARGGPAVNESPAAFLAGAKTPAKAGPNWSIALAGALAAVSLAAAVQLWPTTPKSVTRIAAGPAGQHPGHRPAPSRPVPAAAPAPSPSKQAAAVDVRIAALTGSSWIGITNAAGKQLFGDLLRQGQTQEFTDPAKLDVVVGNPGAVDIVVNGRDLGAQGPSGRVFHGSFGPGPA